MNNLRRIKQLSVSFSLLLGIGLVSVPSLSFAASTSNNTTSDGSVSSATQQQHLANIKSRGGAEIDRRLTQLNKLNSIISSSTHLTAADQSSLSAEVNTEISGLTGLKTTLDAETTLSAAITDAKNIISEYRVYALVTPKLWLIKAADDQQSVETKLSALATKLQSRITADQNAGKNITALQSDLSGMNTEISSAQSISSSVESSVLPLQPTDYNADNAILSGYAAKLKTARSDDQSAYSSAKDIVSGLKNL